MLNHICMFDSVESVRLFVVKTLVPHLLSYFKVKIFQIVPPSHQIVALDLLTQSMLELKKTWFFAEYMQ